MGTMRDDGQVTYGLQTLQRKLPATDFAWHGTVGMRAAIPTPTLSCAKRPLSGPEHP